MLLIHLGFSPQFVPPKSSTRSRGSNISKWRFDIVGRYTSTLNSPALSNKDTMWCFFPINLPTERIFRPPTPFILKTNCIFCSSVPARFVLNCKRSTIGPTRRRPSPLCRSDFSTPVDIAANLAIVSSSTSNE